MTDWSTGDLICPDCGLVVGDRVVDTSYSISLAEAKDWYSAAEEMAMRLHAPDSIGQAAQAMYEQFPRKSDALAGACLFAACRRAGVPRTFAEIGRVSGSSKKELSQALKLVQAKFDTGRAEQRPKSYVNRFGSMLGLSFRTIRDAEDLAEMAYMDQVNRSAVAIAAACIHMVSTTPLADISKVTGVSKLSIMSCRNEICL